MKINNFYWRVLITVYSLLYIAAFQVNGQKTEIRLQLLDQNSKKPISYAHYSIGSKLNISDSAGYISFSDTNAKTLQISHILYGQTQISGAKLKEAIQTGFLPLTTLELSLQPAIIMGVHNSNRNKMLEIESEDFLTHDAGSYLEQNAAISSIKKSGSYGFDPVFRGFKYDQLNIIIDGGQCANAACPNRMDPPASQISLNMMDHVEILKGPHSLRYGNSFGGTFHFVSPTPEYSENIQVFGRGSGRYETNGSISRTEAMLGLREKWLNLKAFGSYSEGANYTDGDGEKISSTFLRGSFGGNIDFKLTKKQNLSISVTNNIAEDVDFPSLPMDLRNDNTLLFNARHTAIFKNKGFSSLKTMIFGSLVDHEMDNLVRETRSLNATTLANTKTYGGRTEGRFNVTSGWLYLGADVRINEQFGERTRTMTSGMTMIDNVWQDGIMQQFGGFGEFHYKLNGSYLFAALRLDINNSEIRDADPNFSVTGGNSAQDYINLSASLGTSRNINNTTKFGLWFGRAQRSGSLTELYMNYFPVGLDNYEMLGNPNLKPEVNNQVDINFKWQPKTAIVDVNIFTSYLTDYISSVIREDLNARMKNAAGVRQFKNIEKAIMLGLELSWKQQLIYNIKHSFNAAYTFAEDLNTNNPLPEIPPMELSYKLYGSFFDKKLKPEISFRYALKQERVSDAFGETPTIDFGLIDFKISYSPLKFMEITAGVSNILDHTYYEHLSRAMKIDNNKPLYARGRSGFVTLSLNF